MHGRLLPHDHDKLKEALKMVSTCGVEDSLSGARVVVVYCDSRDVDKLKCVGQMQNRREII